MAGVRRRPKEPGEGRGVRGPRTRRISVLVVAAETRSWLTPGARSRLTPGARSKAPKPLIEVLTLGGLGSRALCRRRRCQSPVAGKLVVVQVPEGLLLFRPVGHFVDGFLVVQGSCQAGASRRRHNIPRFSEPVEGV